MKTILVLIGSSLLAATVAHAEGATDTSTRSGPLDGWHLGAQVGLGDVWNSSFAKSSQHVAASFDLSVGHDLTSRWSLDAVFGGMWGSDGGFLSIGARPLFRLSDHFDVGAFAAVGFAADTVGEYGLHLGFRAGIFYAAFEPTVLVVSGNSDPFDDTKPPGTVFPVPLRFSLGVRF